MADSNQPIIYKNRYQLQRKLDRENFSTLYLVADLEAENELKVLKVIRLDDMSDEQATETINRTIHLLKLNNKYIVKYYESFIEDTYLYIVTEYCEDGNVQEYLKKQTNILEEDHIIEWLIQILSAIEYIHRSNLFHGNLKLKNLFLKSNKIKITNFDITSLSYPTIDLASSLTEFPYFLAPEVLKNNVFLAISDIWSIGCLLYEMCTFQHNSSDKHITDIIKYMLYNGGQMPHLPELYSNELNDLFKKMLIEDPLKRSNAKELLHSRFILFYCQRNTNCSDQQNQLEIATNQLEPLTTTNNKRSRSLPPISTVNRQIDTTHNSQQHRERESSQSRDLRIKIDTLRKKAINILGEDKFEIVYNYLMEQRIAQKSDPRIDDAKITEGLKAFVKRPEECFVVDQLVFLELI
ncbi:unnamed protein product [Adineta steineri]|uniref:non-specific serine/threonine protein kinase n=1 Tax=Adineta steineri TaxID=433720 RepID=A0A819RHY3_9BILA|nr:unnamed protein product [Adineta steineri]CAF1453063.1 unnamed protein product [Adineta steineri]CAF4035306.1 unnamed protein product [Adineta steineri]CAF4048040.1 unnamed protein product [Adineta steineri]